MKKTITLIITSLLFQLAVAQSDYYWVGGSGDMSDFNNHWAITSGGSNFHTIPPDQNSNLIFDGNSFNSTGQIVTLSATLYCKDLLTKDATNSPTFNAQSNTIYLYGSHNRNSSSFYNNFSSILFYSDNPETVDMGGTAISSLESWRFWGNGSWELISDVNFEANFINIGSTGSLLIGTGVTLTVTTLAIITDGGSLINNGTLIFESGSILENKQGSVISGNDIIFKRNTSFGISEGKYSIVGSPVAGASTSSLGSIVYSYDESQTFIGNDGLDRFVAVASPETMTPGKGYFSANTGTITVAGMPNNGTVNVPLDFSGSVGAEGDYDGFNLVSNPYSTPLKVSTFLTVNGSAGTGAIEDMIYIWVDGGSDTGRRSSNDYLLANQISYVGGSINGATEYNGNLGSFQGLFVQATGTGQTLTFTEAMRDVEKNDDANFYREAPEDIFKIRVRLENEELYSETVIGFLEGATKTLDPRYDAKDIFRNKKLNIATLIDTETYSIQGRPLAYDTDIIALSFDTDTEGVHHLLFDFENMASSQVVNLYDTYTSKAIELNANASYEFTSKAGNFADRFQLLVGPNTITAIDELLKSKVDYTFSPNGVNVTSATAIQSISIYDFQGRIIARMTFDTQEKERFFAMKNNQNRLIIIRATDIYGKVDVQKFNIK